MKAQRRIKSVNYLNSHHDYGWLTGAEDINVMHWTENKHKKIYMLNVYASWFLVVYGYMLHSSGTVIYYPIEMLEASLLHPHNTKYTHFQIFIRAFDFVSLSHLEYHIHRPK